MRFSVRFRRQKDRTEGKREHDGKKGQKTTKGSGEPCGKSGGENREKGRGKGGRKNRSKKRRKNGDSGRYGTCADVSAGNQRGVRCGCVFGGTAHAAVSDLSVRGRIALRVGQADTGDSAGSDCGGTGGGKAGIHMRLFGGGSHPVGLFGSVGSHAGGRHGAVGGARPGGGGTSAPASARAAAGDGSSSCGVCFRGGRRGRNGTGTGCAGGSRRCRCGGGGRGSAGAGRAVRREHRAACAVRRRGRFADGNDQLHCGGISVLRSVRHGASVVGGAAVLSVIRAVFYGNAGRGHAGDDGALCGRRRQSCHDGGVQCGGVLAVRDFSGAAVVDGADASGLPPAGIFVRDRLRRAGRTGMRSVVRTAFCGCGIAVCAPAPGVRGVGAVLCNGGSGGILPVYRRAEQPCEGFSGDSGGSAGLSAGSALSVRLCGGKKGAEGGFGEQRFCRRRDCREPAERLPWANDGTERVFFVPVRDFLRSERPFPPSAGAGSAADLRHGVREILRGLPVTGCLLGGGVQRNAGHDQSPGDTAAHAGACGSVASAGRGAPALPAPGKDYGTCQPGMRGADGGDAQKRQDRHFCRGL